MNAFPRIIFLVVIACMLVLTSCENNAPRILVFSKTKGWKHSSIPSGISALQKLGEENGFAVDTSKNAALFNDSDLKKYDAVVFLSTTGNVLNAEQQAAFERYIQAGGGFAGIHSAAATEYEWSWYNKLMGAHFASHPINPGLRKGVIEVTNKNHPSTKNLPDKWERTEEWYNFRSFYPDINVLAQLDENSYEGGTNGSYHPIAWYHEFDGGRAFYTACGHDETSFTEPLFLQHLLGGIQYAMENGKLDYSKAYAIPVPEENRFVKTILANDLDTPMELAVADDGRVFYTELRSGNVYLYNPATQQNSIVHHFDLCTKGGTGLIGVTLDPDFAHNNFIYLYYSPPSAQEPIIFNLSRFTVTSSQTIDPSSEKILLKVPVQENSGAHHGGSLAWDKDGNLYLSTGDSSSPFPSNGYAPIDERPEKEYFSLDAQRGASNTNDLKGKVLRIHPEADGTYTIPQGNLFPKGTEKTLAEIYVMGCRNPYRIAVNPETSVLYWGEIGPDAGKDSIQGPRGYDEFNQAKKAGNFGWPYFVGNNFAYAEWDFATNTAGGRFDPKAPENNSPNNTGLKKLPPATPAMIWYPYAISKEFPELGQGGRSAMAGSFYQFDDNSKSENKFPEYYDKALFVFDWMRNWVIAVRFDDDENYKSNEPFMPATGDFRRPIDLAFGKDGVMYMLEYGSVYGADNPDARLVRISYNRGNRAPVAKAGIPDSSANEWNKKVFLTSEQSWPQLEEIAGTVPLEVSFSGSQSKDPDDDKLKYEWTIDGVPEFRSADVNANYSFTKNGVYKTILKVTDAEGLTSTDTVVVKVGNSKPKLTIETPDNKSFFQNNKPFRYAVRVSDEEDKNPDARKINVSFVYTADAGLLSSAGPIATDKLVEEKEAIAPGYAKILSSDCKACHTIDKKSVGPSYTDIAAKYKISPATINQLAKKVISGGGGNWGTEHVMSAHPQLSVAEASDMVEFILGIANAKNQRNILPPQGSVSFKSHQENEPRGTYTLTARYTDNGAPEVGALSDSEMIKLRKSKLRPIDADAHPGIDRWGEGFGNAKNKSYVLFKNIDLTNIREFAFEYGSVEDAEVEVRIESLAGPVIANGKFVSTGDWDKTQTLTAKLSNKITGRHHVYFVLLNRAKPKGDIVRLTSIDFRQ
jgi:cytochrome c